MQLNNILSTINFPPLNTVTFKKRECEVGKVVESLAKKSCQENIEKEIENAVLKGATVNENGLIGFLV